MKTKVRDYAPSQTNFKLIIPILGGLLISSGLWGCKPPQKKIQVGASNEVKKESTLLEKIQAGELVASDQAKAQITRGDQTGIVEFKKTLITLSEAETLTQALLQTIVKDTSEEVWKALPKGKLSTSIQASILEKIPDIPSPSVLNLGKETNRILNKLQTERETQRYQEKIESYLRQYLEKASKDPKTQPGPIKFGKSQNLEGWIRKTQNGWAGQIIQTTKYSHNGITIQAYTSTYLEFEQDQIKAVATQSYLQNNFQAWAENQYGEVLEINQNLGIRPQDTAKELQDNAIQWKSKSKDAIQIYESLEEKIKGTEEKNTPKSKITDK